MMNLAKNAILFSAQDKHKYSLHHHHIQPRFNIIGILNSLIRANRHLTAN